MERKVDDIIQAFRDHQFQNSLKLILDMQKKKQKKGKKDTNLSQSHEILVQVLKISALNKLARYGESQEAINSIKLPEKIDVDYTAILLHAIRELQLSQKQKQLISKVQAQKQLIATKQKKGYFVVQHCYINNRKFLDANKFYFNLYNTTKLPINFFNSIYLQFLDILSKNNLLIEKKNQLIQVKEGLDLRMVKMFFEKLLIVCSLENFLKEKIGEEILRFSVRLAIMGKEWEKAAELLEKYERSFSDWWMGVSLWKSIYRYEEGKLDGLLGYYLRLFKENVDLNKYRLSLEAYTEYINLLLKTNSNKITAFHASQAHQLFTLNKQNQPRLNDFLLSLISDLNKKLQLPDKSPDYYKYSVKTSLHSIIYILNQTNNYQQALPYLKQYADLFFNTLTLYQELYQLTKIPFQLEKPDMYKADSGLIFDFNYHKLQYLWKITPIPKTEEQLKQTTLKFVKLYQKGLEFQEEIEVLEKGERYVADEFISILSDIYREYLVFNEDINALMNIISILQFTLKKSSYNFDIKTKLILWYQKLNNPYQLMKIYQTMDIKSSQFQVLGYFIYPQINNFRLYNQFQYVLLRAIRAYQQNQKQIQQYTYNCIQQERHSTIQQFLSYDNYLSRSYSKVNLLYLLSRFPKYRNTINQKYFLKLALRKLSQKLTWSCDNKVIRSTVNFQREKASYFDVFNNDKVLRKELRVRLEQLNLMEEGYKVDEEWEYQVVSVEEVMNPGYQTIQGVYKYKVIGSVEEKELEKSLKYYLILNQLGYRVNQYLRSIHTKQFISIDKVQSLLTILLNQTTTLTAKSMILTQQKLSDIIILLNHYIEPLNKKKKKIKEQESKVLQQLTEVRERCYEIVCGYKVKELEFKLWVESQEFVKEYRNIEKQLNNLALMNKREFDKFYKIQ